MRIAVYITPKSFLNPTGQAKHALNMALKLSQQEDVEVTLLATRDQLNAYGRANVETLLKRLTIHCIGLPSRALHYSWRKFAWPPADHWCGEVDWVYSPTETFIPSRNARRAATIHCANWFEDDLPWSQTERNLIERRRMAGVFGPITENADSVITVSHFLAGRISELLGVEPARLAVIGNGVEDCFFSADTMPPDLSDSRADPFLFAVAYPNRRKGFDALLKVADELARRRTRCRLKIAGSGLGPGETLGDITRRWGEEVAAFLERGLRHPKIDLLGYRSASEVAKLMTQSIAVLVLSRYESFGIPVIEAMAAGAPVIASHFAALPEVVGTAGVLVNPSETSDIVDSALAFASNPERRSHAIKAGRVRAAQFTWGACAERLVLALDSKSNSRCSAVTVREKNL